MIPTRNIQSLEKILKIEDKNVRSRALEDFGKSLKVHTDRAGKFDGSLDEDVLTILIHDAIKDLKTRRSQIMGLLLAGGLLILIGTALIIIMKNLLSG